jgi:hypothetical protein
MKEKLSEPQRVTLSLRLCTAISEEIEREFRHANAATPEKLADGHDLIASEILMTVAGALVYAGEMCAERMGDQALAQDLITTEGADLLGYVSAALDPECPPLTMVQRINAAEPL